MTIRVCNFFVPGRPMQAGSKTAIPIKRNGDYLQRNGRIVMRYVDDAGMTTAGRKMVVAWKDIMVSRARHAMGGRPPCLGPVEISFKFELARPASHYTKDGVTLRKSARLYPTIKPDLLKLARLAEDVLAGIVYKDDAQIVDERLQKFYGTQEGLWVVVNEIEC